MFLQCKYTYLFEMKILPMYTNFKFYIKLILFST